MSNSGCIWPLVLCAPWIFGDETLKALRARGGAHYNIVLVESAICWTEDYHSFKIHLI